MFNLKKNYKINKVKWKLIIKTESKLKNNIKLKKIIFKNNYLQKINLSIYLPRSCNRKENKFKKIIKFNLINKKCKKHKDILNIIKLHK